MLEKVIFSQCKNILLNLDTIKEGKYTPGVYLRRFKTNTYSYAVPKIRRVIHDPKTKDLLLKLGISLTAYEIIKDQLGIVEVESFLGNIPEIAIIALHTGEYYITKKETEFEEAKKTWPRFIADKKESIFKLYKKSIQGDDVAFEIDNAVDKAIKKDNTTLTEIKISSRAHTHLIDNLLLKHDRVEIHDIKSKFYFLNYEKRLEKLISAEVQNRKKYSEEMDPLLKEGMNSGYFIPDERLDLIMNLFRMLITSKKLSLIKNAVVGLYDSEEPSLRGFFVDDDQFVFSMFKRFWPGITDRTVSTQNENMINYGFNEMEKLGTYNIDLSTMTKNVSKILHDELEKEDKHQEKLHYVWKFLKNPDIDKSNWKKWEKVWSDCVASELQVLAYNKKIMN